MPETPRFGWRLLLTSTALAAIAAAMVVVALGGDDADDPPTTTVATMALDPEVPVDAATASFTEFDGTEVPLSSLHGTPTVINFFASTCAPCVTEMPAFEEVHQALGDKVAFVGLALQDRKDAALDLVDRTGITYRTAQDRDASIFQVYDGTVLPTTVLLDASGTVVATHAGQLGAAELRELIADELGITP